MKNNIHGDIVTIKEIGNEETKRKRIRKLRESREKTIEQNCNFLPR